MICTLAKYYKGGQIEEDDMDGARDTHQKCMQDISGYISRKETTWKAEGENNTDIDHEK
jgi:hypothetical protein